MGTTNVRMMMRPVGVDLVMMVRSIVEAVEADGDRVHTEDEIMDIRMSSTMFEDAVMADDIEAATIELMRFAEMTIDDAEASGIDTTGDRTGGIYAIGSEGRKAESVVRDFADALRRCR